MRYTLVYDPGVLAFIRQYPGLARAVRIRLFTALNSDLRFNADEYRNDPTRRVPGNPSLFSDQVLIGDTVEGGPDRVFRFYVSDASAVAGVLRVRFVDEVERPSA